MKKLCLLVALLFFPVALGANFTVDVEPKEINATQVVSLNFTLYNLDNFQNITAVYITLPSGFSYEGGWVLIPREAGTCEWLVDINILKCYGNPLIMKNSAINISFSVYASVASPPDYTFTFDAIDTNGSKTQNTTNITVKDVTCPVIDSVSPANNTEIKYSPGAIYIFNATFSDNIAVNSTEFFLNGRLEQVNYTNRQSTFSIILVKKDLSAGTYTWSWRVNDTSGNSNSSGDYILSITKADNPITVYFNGTPNQNITLYLDGKQNITLNITILAAGDITAYLDGKDLTTPQTNIYNATPIFNTTGTHELFVNATGNANYTANTTGVRYQIKVAYLPAQYKDLVLPSNTYSPGASYTFKITWYSPVAPLNNITNVSFAWQGETYYLPVTNNSYETYSYTVNDLAAGNYTWKWCAKDSQGEENCTEGTFTVNKATPSLMLLGIKSYITPANITVVGLGCPTEGAADVSCSFYVNDTLITGNTYNFIAESEGTWVFVFNTSGGANYTSASITGVVTVTNPINQTTTTTTIPNQTTTTLPSQTTTTTIPTSQAAPILNETKVFDQVTVDSPAIFELEQPGIFKIEKIEVSVKQKASNVKITVAPATKVDVSPPISADKGSVFAYIEITSTLSESSINQVKINFEVTKSWIQTNKIDPKRVALYRWSGTWQKLETKKIGEDSNYVHYQAISPGFSLYAIAGEKAGGVPWNLILVAVVIVVALILAYLFWPTETGREYEQLKRKWSRPFHLKFLL